MFISRRRWSCFFRHGSNIQTPLRVLHKVSSHWTFGISLLSKCSIWPQVVLGNGRLGSASHLFCGLPLHLWGTWSRRTKNAGSNANSQVEGIHLVLLGVALYAVQHGYQMSQQKQILSGQKRQEPERWWGRQLTHLEWKTDCCSCKCAPVRCFFFSNRNSVFCDKSDTHIFQNPLHALHENEHLQPSCKTVN